MKEWIGLVGVIIGGLLTWFVSTRQRKFDQQKERRALLLSKFEELHMTLGELTDAVSEITNQILSEAVFDSSFDANKVKRRIPSEKIDMLIEFYVPELKNDHEYIKKQVQFFYEHLTKHIFEVNRTKQFKMESAGMASALNSATMETLANMKKKLAKSAESLVSY